mgnify:FL=1
MKKTVSFFSVLFLSAAFFATSLSAAESISAGDVPDGFAGQSFSFANIKTDSAVTVSSKRNLLNALKKGGVIYVDGMIDLSEGMFPEKSGEANAALDAFVQKNSNYSSYAEYRDAYVAACTTSTEESAKSSSKSPLYETMHSLNMAYKSVILLSVPSDTVIIGLTADSGFSGGSVSISKASNVVLRNLVIRDAYDPFPHHEANDGFNSQHDCVLVENSSNVWIDHCTFYDTKEQTYVKTGGSVSEKWVTYDGLCDITKESTNVTVSYCKFMDHNKTMLIGSSDSEKIDAANRKVTLHHNYFYNCASRLPMVRLSTIHLYNNYYDASPNSPYGNSYALGVRYNSLIQAEANYYGGGIKNSYSGSAKKPGKVYSVNEIDRSKGKKKSGEFKTSKTPLFDIPYSYDALPADKVQDYVKENAGAGKLPVVR